ncbi:lipopolysaccharide biosynthesis protein [Oceaniradius stylonematis]|uniref:lipopolysaccharide biosynthesis protein n=1 Tax=Oceaniradius stylonematis TaxID=2184161 RepID=UPI00273F4977|nr:lipopolysaccharide biosynthesis protein [Oceaniradius stylonematis]
MPNPIIRSIGITGASAVVAQGLVVLSIPLTARLFSEEAFGVFNLFTNIANIMVVLCHLGFMDAILSARSQRHARRILFAINSIHLLTVAVATVGVFALVRFDVFGLGQLPIWLVALFPAQIVLVSLCLQLQLLRTRFEQFGTLAASNVSLGASRASGQILFGLLGGGVSGLVFGELLSRLVGMVTLAYPDRARLSRGVAAVFFASPTSKRLRVLSPYRAFAAVRLPTLLMVSLNIALPSLLIANLFELREVGYFALMHLVLLAPIGLTQKAFGDVITGTFSGYYRNDRRRALRFVLISAGLLTAASIAGALVLIAIAPTLFTVLFGEKWAPSGVMAQYFAFAIAFMTASIPLSPILNVIERPGIPFAFNLIQLAGFAAVYVASWSIQIELLDVVLLLAANIGAAHALYLALILVRVGLSCRGDGPTTS